MQVLRAARRGRKQTFSRLVPMSFVFSGILAPVSFLLAQERTGGLDLAFLPDISIATNVATANSDYTTPGRPAVGFDGTNYLVVSSRSAGNPAGLFGVIVSHRGAVLNRFQITTQAAQFSSPSIAFDRTNYLVVFQREGEIFGRRLTPSGVMLDAPDGFPISTSIPGRTSNYGPDVAFDGQSYLVVWNKFVDFDYEIFGARVTRSGQVLSEFPIFIASGEQVEAAVTFGSGNYLVVWRDTRNGGGPSSSTDVFGTRVSSQGIVLDPEGIAICSAPEAQVEPHVAFEGQNYFVVWLDSRRNDSRWHIFGTRIRPDGTLLDGPAGSGGIAINVSPTAKRLPRVAFDGRDLFVTWWVDSYFPPTGIFSARVTTTGILLDGPADDPGVQIRQPDSFACCLVHPNSVFNGRSLLVAWVYVEAEGTYKGVRACLAVPRPRFTKLGAGAADVTVTFESRRNMPYQVEASTDLSTWGTLGALILGTGEPLEVILSGEGGNECKFFRVRLEY